MRGGEIEESRTTALWVVAQNTMMGLYFPSVLSVSVYLFISSSSVCMCATSPHWCLVSTVHGALDREHDNAVI